MKQKKQFIPDVGCLGCLYCAEAKKNGFKCSKGHKLTASSSDECADKIEDDGVTHHGPGWFSSQMNRLSK